MRTLLLLGAILVAGGAWWGFMTHPRVEPTVVPDALTLAQHAPLFGLAGTDPDALLSSTEKLAVAQKSLEEAQEDPEDAALISSLYPLDFLRELAALEKNRRTFITSGSDDDKERYHAQLAVVIDVYARELEEFTEAFATAVGTSPVTIVGFGGTTTAQRQRDALTLLEGRVKDIRAEYNKRTACIAGDAEQCDESWLQTPFLLSDTSVSPREIPSIVADINGLFREIKGPSVSAPLIAPLADTCLQALSPPHYVKLLGGDTTPFSVAYASDLFFSPTAGSNGPVMGYLSERDISYAPVNPLTFYTCPEIGSLIGAAEAAIAVAEFARQHPTLVSEENVHLFQVSNVVYEADAHRYVEVVLAAVRASGDISLEEELNDLSLMLAQKSAGLELLIENIVRTLAIDVGHKAEGVQFNLSAKNLFLSHSAFPSLFLAQHPTVGAPIQSYESTETNSRYVRYSELRTTIPREQIISDMRAFLSFEGLLPH